MHSLNQTDKKIIGILLIALLAVVLSVSLIYAAASQPNPTQNNPSPTPTPKPTPTPAPTPTPTPAPTPTATPIEVITEPKPIPEPSVPEFTVEYFDSSYYVEPTTTLDPYTGELVRQGGYYAKGTPKIVITIKNQPVTCSKDYFFSVRVKGHYSQDWAVIGGWVKGVPAGDLYVSNPYPEQDHFSNYTVLTYVNDIPSSGEMDFQVQALIGHVSRVGIPDRSGLYNMYYAQAVFHGKASDWSETQTIKIP